MCSSCVWAPPPMTPRPSSVAIPMAPVKLPSEPPPCWPWRQIEADLAGDAPGALVERHGRRVRRPQRPHRSALDLDAHVRAHAGEAVHHPADLGEGRGIARHAQRLGRAGHRHAVHPLPAVEDADRIGGALVEIRAALQLLDDLGHDAHRRAAVLVGPARMRGAAVGGQKEALEGVPPGRDLAALALGGLGDQHVLVALRLGLDQLRARSGCRSPRRG